MTWRQFIRRSPRHERAERYRKAILAGLTYREVAEAAGLVVSTVHHMTGRVERPRAQLDDEVPEEVWEC